jgi:hypothetical protein
MWTLHGALAVTVDATERHHPIFVRDGTGAPSMISST